MAAFRFRAAAALDARRKQEDAAAAVFTQAEARWRAARTRLDDLETRRRDGARAFAETEREGVDGPARSWYRNWIIGLQVAREQLNQEVERLAGDMRVAEQAWYNARRRRLVLDRLRDRLWRRHRLADEQREMKDMNELARVRFAASAAELGRTLE